MFTCYGVVRFTFCHLFHNRSLFFGDISPKIDPSVFLEYVCSIYDHYQKKYRTFDKRKNASKIQTPLIVNTSGWVKGELVSFQSLI